MFGFDEYLSPEVHQATGMIAVQLECSIADAFVHLEARAAVRGVDLHDLAVLVIERSVRFDG